MSSFLSIFFNSTEERVERRGFSGECYSLLPVHLAFQFSEVL